MVRLSQRALTAVHLPEKDPKFPDWDGDRTHLLLWLHQVDQIRQTKEITDTVEVRFARHAMGVAAYGHLKEVPPSWTAFVKVLENHVCPPFVYFVCLPLHGSLLARLTPLAQLVGFRPLHSCYSLFTSQHHETIKKNGRNKDGNPRPREQEH